MTNNVTLKSLTGSIADARAKGYGERHIQTLEELRRRKEASRDQRARERRLGLRP